MSRLQKFFQAIADWCGRNITGPQDMGIDGFPGLDNLSIGYSVARDWYQEENLAALEGLKIHYGPAIIDEFVAGVKLLPANSMERLSLAQEHFGRDGQYILMLVEAAKTV